eukprot:gene7691-8498_t
MLTGIYAEASKPNIYQGSSELQRSLYKKFEKSFKTMVDGLQKQVNHALEKIEARLVHCEDVLRAQVRQSVQHYEAELSLAEVLVNKELRGKVILSQWTNRFLSAQQESGEQQLDPITFAISRYCLNVALCVEEVSPSYLLQAKLASQLVHFASMDRPLVVGPALLALCHLSFFPVLKVEIVATANALPVLLKLLLRLDCPALLAQAAKLLASLALAETNKALICQSGCMHALYDLVSYPNSSSPSLPSAAHATATEIAQVQYYTLLALININHHSEASRRLAMELQGFKPLLALLRKTNKEGLLLQCVRVIANMVYGNTLPAQRALLIGAGETLLAVLESVDVTGGAGAGAGVAGMIDGQHGERIAHAVLAAFANMCLGEANQTHIGNIPRLIETSLRILQHAQAPFLVAEAANFLLASAFKNTINKSRIASKQGCAILSARLHLLCGGGGGGSSTGMGGSTAGGASSGGGSGSRQTKKEAKAIYWTASRIAQALASVLLYPSTHEAFYVCGGLNRVVDVCKSVNDHYLLQEVGKVLVTLVPNPAELLRLHQDSCRAEVEKANVLPLLKKIKFQAFPESAVGPDWLETALTVLTMSDYDLSASAGKSAGQAAEEFVPSLFYCKEFEAETQPDASLRHHPDFKGLIFSIY